MTPGMRDLELIDSELRLLAGVRRTYRAMYGRVPSTLFIDALLDERNGLATKSGQPPGGRSKV